MTRKVKKCLFALVLFTAPNIAVSHDLEGIWTGEANGHAFQLIIDNSSSANVKGSESGGVASVIKGATDGNMVMFLRHNQHLANAQFYSGTIHGNTISGYFCHHDNSNQWVCSYQWSVNKQ